MPKVSPLQSNFNGGEFSPLLYGRVDTERYATGLATCLNYIPTIQGGLVRRPGTYFVTEVKDSTKACRLVPFEFSTTQAYILEFGDQYLRFYRDHAQITSGGSPYEIATTYLEAELPDLRFTQSADVLYITHPDHPPAKLSRTGHTAWTLSDIDFLDGPYLGTDLSSGVTLTLGATNGTGVSLTASADTFAATDVGRQVRLQHAPRDWAASTAYVVGDIVNNDSGKVYECITAGTSAGSGGPTGVEQSITDNTVVWKYLSTTTTYWGYATVDGYTDPQNVTVTVGRVFANTTATEVWRLGVWSDTTGYPAHAIFHENRLFFAGAPGAPQRIDGSYSADYENMAPTDPDGTVTDAHAVGYTLNSNQVNVIRWMAADERGLMVGTAGGEWIVRPSLRSEALSPTNIAAKQSTTYGSADIAPVVAGKAALYVQRAGRKVRELRYFLQEDGFQAPDLTMLAEHIAGTGFKELAHQKEPQSLVWCARNDGVLACCTYDRDLESLRVGWHRHVLGGVGDASGGDPVVESVATIPSPDGTSNELWVLVRRYINGATVRYVEYLTQMFRDIDVIEDAHFVDSGLAYDGAATDTLSGLDHLEGETLAVLADGAVHPDVTVSGGSITLEYEASVVHVGYAYNSDGQMLRIEAGARDGTALGKTRRVHRVGMLLHRTLGLSIGMDFDTLYEYTFRTSADEDGVPPDLFSGIISETVEANYDFENQFCWRQSQPLPGTILAIMPQMVTQDRG